MTEYDFICTVCNGAFSMNVRTGYRICAANRKRAMQAAKRLDSILSESFDLQCYFELNPTPHITVKGTDRIHQKDRHPALIGFQVQKNFDSPQKLLGYPIFSDDDFKEVTQADFVQELVNTYSGIMKAKDKTRLGFECISYAIEKIKNQNNPLD